MRILQVVHGYPPRYNAGSEVYTQTLCRELSKRHELMVFARFEDAFMPPYSEIEEEDTSADGRTIPLQLINLANFRDRYRHEAVDAAFVRMLQRFRPDVVHVQHLNHLSTSVVLQAPRAGVPVVFTLHDFWLMCPRGQFIQFFPSDACAVLALCDGQEDRKCAERCYARYFSGAPEDADGDVDFHTDWVRRRMAQIREVCEGVERFIAPSRQLQKRFIEEFGIRGDRIDFLDYGFDRRRLEGRQRQMGEPFVFGYIGTHVASKGIHQLLAAFARMNHPNARLRIWGRPNAESTPALKSQCDSFPNNLRVRISWEGEYSNERIVPEVFNRVDAIVVPSLWLENSPLVIHEAQQARVPVITADAGGMAEFVRHEVNGLLFRHRDPSALAVQMARCVDDPELISRLGQRGYLYDDSGNVPAIEEHCAEVERIYCECVAQSIKTEEVNA